MIQNWSRIYFYYSILLCTLTHRCIPVQQVNNYQVQIKVGNSLLKMQKQAQSWVARQPDGLYLGISYDDQAKENGFRKA